MFSVLSLSVSAEDGSSEVLDVRDFTYECYYGDDNENNEKLPLTVTDATFGSDGIWMRNYSCSSNASVKTLILTDLTDLIAEHEYNLEFYYATDYINTTVLGIELRYYTSTGEWIKTQTLAQFTPKKVGNQLYSGNFKPDVSGINQSYNIKLCILFLTPNTSTCSWRISHDIKLTDKDDNSGWFQKILNAIKAIPDNIRSFFTNLGDRISGFFDELGVKFDNMKESVVNAFVTLKDDLLGGLESLFIPTDDYFDRKSDEMQQWGADHFGFLWELSDLLISTVQNLKGLLQDGYVFILPAAEFDLNGEHYVLWEEYEVPVAEYIESVAALKYSYNTYLIVISGICGVALFNYARKTFDKVTAN